jgi:hypothetical protein
VRGHGQNAAIGIPFLDDQDLGAAHVGVDKRGSISMALVKSLIAGSTCLYFEYAMPRLL